MKKRKNDRPLHILHVVGDPVGGIRRHVHSLLRGLDPSEFSLSYAYSCFSVDSTFSRDMEVLCTQLHAEIPLNVYKKPHQTDIGNILQLYRFIREAEVDVVHGHGAKGGLYARIAGRLAGVHTVYTPHGGAAHDMFSFLSAKVYQSAEHFLAYFTDYYLFESSYTADAMRRKLGKLKGNWSINPNGIEPLADFNPRNIPVRPMDADREGVTRFGIFAMLREEKGQSYAIEAVAELLHEGKNVSLHLFGDGVDRIKLMDKVQTLGCANAIFFYGDVSPAIPWMTSMDVIVIPSLFESFGYVAIEALALGKPVIASATGGLIDILLPYDGAMLVPPANANLLRGALDSYLNSPSILQSAAKRVAHAIQEKYSATTMVLGAASVYQMLASHE